MEKVDLSLLETIADLHGVPAGAYNIRKNGGGIARQSPRRTSPASTSS